MMDLLESTLSSSSDLNPIDWIGLVAVPIAAICSSLLFAPAPFLRTLNGIPLALFTSSGLLIGSLAGWAVVEFYVSEGSKFFYPAMMIGGCGFTLFMIFGVFAVRLLGIAGASSVLSGTAVIFLWITDKFGLFDITWLKLTGLSPITDKGDKWFVYAFGIVVIVGIVLGVCVHINDGMDSSYSGYHVIQAINSELGTYNEDSPDTIDSLLDQRTEKKKKRIPRPGENEAREDSGVTRWFMDRSPAVRRILGIILSVFAALFLVVQFSWLLYAQQPMMDSSSSIVSTDVVSSSSNSTSIEWLKQIPFCNIFAFSCGAFVSAVFFVIVFGLIACNKPSLPAQGALPCVFVGIIYAIGIYAWIFAHDKLTSPIGNSLCWGIVPLFCSIWGLIFKEQKGVAGHLFAALSVFCVVVGSVLLGIAQRGFKNLKN